jgi:hypothetical protein
MKKSFFSFLVVCLCITAFGQEGTYTSLSDYKNSLSGSKSISWHMNIPIGSTLTITDKVATINLPKGVRFVGFDETGRAEVASSGSYTCTCETADGTCTPFIAGSSVGCTTDVDKGCSKCSGKKATSLTYFNGFAKAYYVHDATPTDKGFLDGFAEIQAVRDVYSLVNIPPVDEEILNSRDVEDAIAKITENLEYNKELDFSGGKIPEGYSLVPVIIKEHLAYLVVPQAKVEAGMIECLTLSFDSDLYSSVSCSGCNSTCKLDTKAFGQVKYCAGCKSGCTISW